MRKIISVLSLFALLYIIITLVYISFFTDAQSKEVEFNSRNFEMSEVTDEQLTCIGENYNGYLVSERRSGNESGIEDSKFKKADSDEIDFSTKRIDGIKTLMATRTKAGRLTMEIDYELISGEAKLYVIVGTEIVEYIKPGQNTTFYYDVKDDCNVYLKLVAKNAELKISAKRTFN